MEEPAEKAATKAAESVVEAEAPSDEAVKAGWDKLVDILTAKYSKMTRLKNTLTASEIVVSESEGVKTVSFEVVNEAQKSWLEERLLREMESIIRETLSWSKININISVTPEEKTEKVLYMPEEKAKDLIEKNSEVREFVSQLGLDVK